MVTAFDYDTQQWVEGPAARPILIEQARATLDLLRSSKGCLYLQAIGSPDSMTMAIAKAERHLSDVS